MSLADLIVSDVVDVFLNTDDHARTIQVTSPKGTDARPYTGVWDVSIEREVDATRGREVVYNATFAYAATDVIQAESSAIVDGVSWVCLSPGASHAGLKTSHWEGRLKVNNNANGGR
jgi:hypothetical protein